MLRLILNSLSVESLNYLSSFLYNMLISNPRLLAGVISAFRYFASELFEQSMHEKKTTSSTRPAYTVVNLNNKSQNNNQALSSNSESQSDHVSFRKKGDSNCSSLKSNDNSRFRNRKNDIDVNGDKNPSNKLIQNKNSFKSSSTILGTESVSDEVLTTTAETLELNINGNQKVTVNSDLNNKYSDFLSSIEPNLDNVSDTTQAIVEDSEQKITIETNRLKSTLSNINYRRALAFGAWGFFYAYFIAFNLDSFLYVYIENALSNSIFYNRFINNIFIYTRLNGINSSQATLNSITSSFSTTALGPSGGNPLAIASIDIFLWGPFGWTPLYYIVREVLDVLFPLKSTDSNYNVTVTSKFSSTLGDSEETQILETDSLVPDVISNFPPMFKYSEYKDNVITRGMLRWYKNFFTDLGVSTFFWLPVNYTVYKFADVKKRTLYLQICATIWMMGWVNLRGRSKVDLARGNA